MEGTHGQLGARLTDRLGRHDTHGLADVHELSGRQRPAVALCAHTHPSGAGERGAHLHRFDAGIDDLPDDHIAEVGAGGHHNIARGVHRIGCERPRVGRGLGVTVTDERSVRSLAGDTSADAALGAAVVLADDDILADVDQPPCQIP